MEGRGKREESIIVGYAVYIVDDALHGPDDQFGGKCCTPIYIRMRVYKCSDFSNLFFPLLNELNELIGSNWK
jgi:hypothetical protein